MNIGAPVPHEGLGLVGFNLPMGAVVIPKNYAVKYAVQFFKMYVEGGMNPPPAAAPGKLNEKDNAFLFHIAMLPDSNNVLFTNLMELKNNEQALVDQLDQMYDNFVVPVA